VTALIVTLSLIGTVCYVLGAWISPWVGWCLLVWIGIDIAWFIRNIGNKTGPAEPWYVWVLGAPIMAIALVFGQLNHLFQDLMKLP
jgi:hypothetical protein